MFYEEYMALVKKDRLPKYNKLLNSCPRLDDDGARMLDLQVKKS